MNYFILVMPSSLKSLHPFLRLVCCPTAFATKVKNLLLHMLSIKPLPENKLRMHIMHEIIDWVESKSFTKPLGTFNV